MQADATLEMEQRDFARAALEYVCLIQEVQERKKFEFVERIPGGQSRSVLVVHFKLTLWSYFILKIGIETNGNFSLA